jgi:hypothetical protein
LEQAMTDDTATFGATCTERVKELNKARREGRDPNAKQEFVPTPRLRKLSELKDELENASVGPAMCVNARTAAEGFKLALQWFATLDEASVAEKKAKFDARIAKQDEDRAKAAVAREEKKAAEAQAKIKELREKSAV